MVNEESNINIIVKGANNMYKQRTPNKYLVVWNGGSAHVNTTDRAKDTICNNGFLEGD